MNTLKKITMTTMSAVLFSAVFSSAQARELKLMSYNVHHCAGADGKIDIARTAKVIASEVPDYVGLQELDRRVAKRSGGIDQPAEIGRLAGLHVTFAKAIPYQGGDYGNAVLSREKPLSVERIPLPGGSEPRVLVLCEFADCWFGTTHLGRNNPQTEPDRMKSVEIIRGIVTEKAKSKPVFLSGDWNARPKSDVLKAMRGFMTILSREDWQTGHDFVKRPREHCIDYLAVDTAHAAAVRTKETHIIHNYVASDHNPIAATVSVVASPCAMTAPLLRLATYNIHHGEGKDGRYDIRRMLDYVESAGLDVFGLNEVNCKSRRVHGADTPAEIAQLTGMNVEYAAARTYGGGSYGNAVVSKEKPLSTERIDLPRGNGEKGLKCSLMLCEFTNFWFGSTHFEVRSALTNQLKSVEILRKIVAEKSKTKPVFLSGDWNNEPDSVTLAKMREFMAVLNDPKVRTYTGFRVRPKDDEYCIDYIAVDNAHAGTFKVTERRVKSESFVSDHNPVFVTLEKKQAKDGDEQKADK